MTGQELATAATQIIGALSGLVGVVGHVWMGIIRAKQGVPQVKATTTDPPQSAPRPLPIPQIPQQIQPVKGNTP